MRRPRAIAALAVGAALALPASDQALDVSGKPRKRGPARVLVTGTEFSLQTSRSRLRSGRVIVQFQNAGEDVHNLRIR